jgi:hypothetical protein
MRALIAMLLVACGDTGQPAIELRAVGTGTAATPIEIGGYRVTLDVARIAFGPITFCASRAASDDLCPSALAELAAAAPLDVLSPAAQPLGVVNGFVGTARSAGYGYGITWLPIQTSPQATRAAVAGHSAHLEGTAVDKATGASFRFNADVDIVPLNRGTHPVTATGIDAALDQRTRSLDVRFDPTRWLAQIDFAELAAAGTPTVTIAPGSNAYNALVTGITTLAPPQFVFSR